MSIAKISEEAKFYANIGWQVIPCYGVDTSGQCNCSKGQSCKSPGKHPRLNEWQSKATTDPKTIDGWLTKWPESNLGVRLGPSSDLLDIEYDSDEGKATASELLDDTKTPSFKSKRSVHHLFAFPTELTIPKAVVHWRGLELRFGTDKAGAQSIFPPSRHASGVNYEWIRHPSKVGVADPPEWLSEALAGDTPSQSDSLPRVSDGSLLFLLHLISKIRQAKDGGSRIGIVLNGSPLFTGGAGSGESEIRRYVLENDLVEAIIGLPTEMFYNWYQHLHLDSQQPQAIASQRQAAADRRQSNVAKDAKESWQ